MATLDRIKVRLEISNTSKDGMLNELILTAEDRIMLRAGIAVMTDGTRTTLPADLASIAVEVVVKAYRRIEYEGIRSESADTLNTSFVDDILDEYSLEIEAYRKNSIEKVRFL